MTSPAAPSGVPAEALGDGHWPSRGLAHEFDFPPPHADMRACIVVPARNEEQLLPRLIASLADQRRLDGTPVEPRYSEVLLLLNNCSDGTSEIARALQSRHPRLTLHVRDIEFTSEDAHVGRARQALFDVALERFRSLGRESGLILTTDADSRPAQDWIAQNEAEVAAGVDGVGGRITLDCAEHAALPAGVRRFFLLDIGYRRALEALRHLYAPEPHDPFPRHHQHFGSSLSVTARAYARAGGMPLRRSSEDVALYRAVLESGGRFRHSYRVRVQTSARMVGRAPGGLSDAIRQWSCQADEAAPVLVESATAADKRLGRLGLWSAANPGCCPPLVLAQTPEPPPPDAGAEIHQVLRELRVIVARLTSLPLAARLQHARQTFADPPGFSFS